METAGAILTSRQRHHLPFTLFQDSVASKWFRGCYFMVEQLHNVVFRIGTDACTSPAALMNKDFFISNLLLLGCYINSHRGSKKKKKSPSTVDAGWMNTLTVWLMQCLEFQLYSTKSLCSEGALSSQTIHRPWGPRIPSLLCWYTHWHTNKLFNVIVFLKYGKKNKKDLEACPLLSVPISVQVPLETQELLDVAFVGHSSLSLPSTSVLKDSSLKW